jgi:hypothetical protein
MAASLESIEELVPDALRLVSEQAGSDLLHVGSLALPERSSRIATGGRKAQAKGTRNCGLG